MYKIVKLKASERIERDRDRGGLRGEGKKVKLVQENDPI